MKSRIIVLLILVMLASLLATSAALAAPAAPGDDSNQVVSSGPTETVAAKVWTADEMAKALPYPMDEFSGPMKDALLDGESTGAPVMTAGGRPDEKAAQAVAEALGPIDEATAKALEGALAPDGYAYPPPFTRFTFTNWLPDYKQYPFRTIGKVFFTMNGQNYVCSGSVAVNRAVWTAGHCVYNNATHRFHTNWVFVPAYRNGAAPYGQWTARELWTLTGYQNGNQGYDIGMAVLNDKSGHKIAQVTGWLGYMANAGRVQHWMDFGYPQAAPFNGQYQYVCAASHARDDGAFNPATIGIGCDMTGGSSGGPWIVKLSPAAGATNYVNGVNSYKYTNPNQPLQMYSPYFGQGAINLYNAVVNR